MEPKVNCPYCGEPCDADFVDIGVGMMQCGPYHCLSCGASEIGPYDEDRPLSDQESKFKWYAPGAEPGSSANVINGRIVSAEEMRAAYRADYPRIASDEWREEIRKPKGERLK